jgi:translation initiation factor IF-3
MSAVWRILIGSQVATQGTEAPIVRIMDYARKQFEQRKKVKEQKKTKIVSRRLAEQKEVQLRYPLSPYFS